MALIKVKQKNNILCQNATQNNCFGCIRNKIKIDLSCNKHYSSAQPPCLTHYQYTYAWIDIGEMSVSSHVCS